MISVVACCHGAKLCAHTARDFRWQQNGAVTRIGTKSGESSHIRRSDRLYKTQLCCALHSVYCAAHLASFLFSGELPNCKLCDVLACWWIRADGLRISHDYAKMPLTYHACNLRKNFLPYFTIVCWCHEHCWNSFRAACSSSLLRDYRGFHYRGSRNFFCVSPSNGRRLDITSAEPTADTISKITAQTIGDCSV